MRSLVLLLLSCLAMAGEARPDPRQAAAELDALITAELAAQGIAPQPQADDWTLLRRA